MVERARRVRIDLAYDGTEFHGWQIQPGRRTVQGVLAESLTRLQGGRPAQARGAGRTDAGVHARGQVADCLIRSRLDDAGLAHALRGLLPRDLRPLRVRSVAAEFHARVSARAKVYVYEIDRSVHGDPFRARYALHEPGRLAEDAIRAALERLPGRRDWSGFTAAGCEVDDRVRTLGAASLETAEESWRLIFRADGFLRYMVRNLVGTLLEIGRGRWPAERLEEILVAGDRSLAGPTAAARGLHLERVVYDAEPPGR